MWFLLPLTACGVTESSLIGTWTIDAYRKQTTEVVDGERNLEGSVTKGEEVDGGVTGTITFAEDESGSLSVTDDSGSGDYPISMWVLSETNLPDDFQTYYQDTCAGDWPAPLSAPELSIATEYLAFNQVWYPTGGSPLVLYARLVNDYSAIQRSCTLYTVELSR